MAAVVQIEAAVVSPRTDSPSLIMVPAPRKPIPVMIPCAIRVGSREMRPWAMLGNQRVSYTVTSISKLVERQTSECVRNPAGRP